MNFERWCAANNASPLPAAPKDVARFVQDNAALGITRLWEAVCEISRAHYLIGLADPTLGGPVSAALNVIAKVEPPRSWPKEQKFRWQQLPYDLQVYVAAREAQRDAEVGRAHNALAMSRNPPPAIQPKGNTNGSTENAAA